MSQDTSPYVFQSKKRDVSLNISNKVPFTDRQLEFIQLAQDKNTKIIFVAGPAGTSKTYLATYVGLNLLAQKRVSDIIYVRSAVESASRSLGLLPGELTEKFAPYLSPLLDKLEEIVGLSSAEKLIRDGFVVPKPINYLRGCHFAGKFIVMDECLEGDVNIETNTGFIKLKDIVKNPNGVLVKSFNEDFGIFEYKPILNVFKRGEKLISEVRLDKRSVLRGTRNHRFLTTDGWKRIDELNVGDAICSSCNTKHSKIPLSGDQFSLLVGGLLGDSSLQNVSLNSYRLSSIHCKKQFKYLKFKAKIWGSKIEYVEKNGYSKKPAFRTVSKTFYLNLNNNDKIKWAIDNSNTKSLAISWMDDGYLNPRGYGILYSCASNEENNKLFAEKLNQFGYDCVPFKTHNGNGVEYFAIRFRKEGFRKFMFDISPFVHTSMKHKVLSEFWQRVGSYRWKKNKSNLSLKVVTDITLDVYKNQVYDIEVQDNHNFCVSNKGRYSTGGFVAHNCQNFTKPELTTAITRIGEFTRTIICGDPMQSDIGDKSSFSQFFNAFNSRAARNKGIFTFKFGNEDIVRSEILKFIVKTIETL